MSVRHEAFWQGYRYGQRLAEWEPSIDHEHRLRLELKLAAGTTRERTDRNRASTLGELRGYRQAKD